MSISRKIGNIASTLDSAAAGAFFAKGAADGQFQDIAYSSLVGAPTAIDSALTSQLIDSSYIQLRQTSAAAGLDSATTLNLIDSSYISTRAGTSTSSGFDIFNYSATANQTIFKDSSSDGTILSYSKGFVLVYYNGLLLADEDYTATDGESLILEAGADSGASVAIAKWAHTNPFGGNDVPYYGPRGFIFGGENSGGATALVAIDYFNIASPGNAADFGDLNVNVRESCALSDATRAVSMGWPTLNPSPAYMEYITCATLGNATATAFSMTANVNYGTSSASNGIYGYTMAGYRGSTSNVIDYITIQSLSNATDHGNLTVAREYTASANDTTRAVCNGGQDAGGTGGTIDYFTMSTSGNASDFGDQQLGTKSLAGCGDATRGIFAGGRNAGGSTNYNSIEYLTFQTLGNTTDFGDLQSSRYGTGASSDQTKATWAGGYSGSFANNIDYVTIQTPANAADFGDCTAARSHCAGCSGKAA